MKKAQIPVNDKKRIEALQAYAILDTLPEADFDGITRLASIICGTPVSLITFIDETRQVFKSHYGIAFDETVREYGFCAHTINGKDLMIVPDVSKDDRFSDMKPAENELKIGFYAGVPLINPEGYALGTLCVIDSQARDLDESQREALVLLANQVMQLLELRKKNAELKDSKNAYKSLFDQNPDAVFSFDPAGHFLSANKALLNMVDASVEELKLATFDRYLTSNYIDSVTRKFKKAVLGQAQNYIAEIISSKGKKFMVHVTNIPNIVGGEVVGVFGIAKDITEKYQLQENLSMILNNTRESFMIVDKALNIVFYNESASIGTKRILDRVVHKGMNILELAGKDRVTKLIQLFNKVFQGEVISTEIPVEIPGKETVWVANTFSPVRDKFKEIDHVIVTTLDITERKKGQIRLEKSELGLKQAQELSHIGNWEIDFIRMKSFWSDEMYKILGYQEGEIEPTLNNYLSTIHPDDIDAVSKMYVQKDDLHKSHSSVHRIVRKTGEIRIVSSENKFILKNDNAVGLYGVLRDITEKENAEAQLRDSEQKTRLIMNASLDAIIWVKEAGTISFWNPQAEKIFGWKQEEVLDKDLIQLIAPETMRRFYYETIQNYRERGEESELNVLIEQTAVNKNGEEFPIELTVLPIKQNEQFFFCVFIRNISERKRFSDELQLSERRYRNLFYMSPLPMFVCDAEKRSFLDVNHAAVRHYGYSYEEFMSMMLKDIHPTETHTSFQKAVSTINKGAFFKGEFKHVKKDGEIIDVDIQSNAIDYSGTEARLILATDITRERENERKLKNLTQSLEQKVNERTLELNAANKMLSYEHQQTKDSIVYAKNIQSSILHRENDIKSLFQESFVLFKPKDKVSGDFFWCHETEEYSLVAVVDCTGHGVPGAMISMVAFQLLNQIVLINGETAPAKVLAQLDEEVSNLFHHHSDRSSLDGMDMVYCRISKQKQVLQFAGAQRPLFFHNSEGLQELKGSKLAIGGAYAALPKHFEEHEVTFQGGDCIYLTSDGYYSQFGGPKNKVMLKKRMKEELGNAAHLPAGIQCEYMKNYFESWQGNEEQVDDVLIIGIKL